MTADSAGVTALKIGATVGSANSEPSTFPPTTSPPRSLTVQNNNTTANTITIGSGKTLTINGNVAIGD